tara:strand:+ start:585 stop:758 length:174 start_codon:yes stop_codon:yes gene_type:complete
MIAVHEAELETTASPGKLYPPENLLYFSTTGGSFIDLLYLIKFRAEIVQATAYYPIR